MDATSHKNLYSLRPSLSPCLVVISLSCRPDILTRQPKVSFGVDFHMRVPCSARATGRRGWPRRLSRGNRPSRTFTRHRVSLSHLDREGLCVPRCLWCLATRLCLRSPHCLIWWIYGLSAPCWVRAFSSSLAVSQGAGCSSKVKLPPWWDNSAPLN